MVDIQSVYDRRAEEEIEKLRLLEEKRKKKGRPAMTEREKTSNATRGLIPRGTRGVINTMPFADIHDLTDAKDVDLPDTKRSDGLSQRWG